jgi:hypothetical protein
MSNEEMQGELERLRKEVAALSQARQEKRPEPPPEEEEALTTAPPAEDDQAMESQVEELIKLLKDEIRDMPTITTVAVFALGILVGRFLR